jgi:diguanylate cyclase (GGDEF)-like protein
MSTRMLVVVSSAIACIQSMLGCLVAYWLLDVHGMSIGERIAMYGLPILVPAIITPLAMMKTMRFMAVIRESNNRLEREVARREEVEARLEVLASLDDLTQLPNRRTFFGRAAELAQNPDALHAVAVVDLDHFKRLNDTAGHPAGDAALRDFGAMLRTAAAEAVIGRLGGEEFGLILRDTTIPDAVATCERLRLNTEHLPQTFTASFGLTDWLPADESIDQALGRADAALYRAKQQGRNRVELQQRSEAGRPVISDLSPLARR